MDTDLELRMGDITTKVSFACERDIVDFAERQNLLMVADTNTCSLIEGIGNDAVIVEAGEDQKNWESVHKIHERALLTDFSRDGCMVGIGGGMVCDLTAFSASLYMRGCVLALVPTTLLAMVDAAIGGKTGINWRGIKNVIGTFYPASTVLICVNVLNSLPLREYMSGLAEVLKTAMIGDSELFGILNEEQEKVLGREPALLSEIVRRCIRVKSTVVQDDLTEQGRRAILNLGHTFGHALESVTGIGVWSHGEAVAWGMAKALALGVHLGITKKNYQMQVIELLNAYGFNLKAHVGNLQNFLEAMRKDKKRRKNALRVVLQDELCETHVVAVDEQDIAAVL